MSILDDLPDATTLGPEALRLLYGLFQDTARDALADGDVGMASWARTIADRYALQLNIHAQQRRELRRQIDEQRREP